MTPEKYVNAIVKKIKCNSPRKNEIRKQLLADINGRLSQGETLERITIQMGTPIEIAEDFNENIPQKEQGKYTRRKILKIFIPILALFVMAACFFYWLIPKGMDIEKSSYFTKEQVTEAMKTTILQFNNADWEALQTNALPQMHPYLSKDGIAAIKSSIPGDWGGFRNFGTVYLTELVQSGKHFAVGEITVAYENVSVTFRLTYDQNMKLSGLYIR